MSDTSVIRLHIVGEPVTWHGFMKGYMTDKQRAQQKRLKTWQHNIAFQVQTQLPDDHEPWDGAIKIVNLIFRVSKPKSSKEKYPTTVGDIDRLMNAVYDALEGVKISRYVGIVGQVYTNDRRIIGHEGGPWKFWATPDNPPGVELQIERMK
jgi:Holliday junction resolvase RusA-like endonuclease